MELSDSALRFSTKQAAQDWVEKQKPEAKAGQGSIYSYFNVLDASIKEILATPKPLRPEELVNGKIYRIDGRLFRYMDAEKEFFVSVYSQLLDDGYFYGKCTGCNFYNSTIRPATLLEEQTLITAEVANLYFHELRNQK